jgi:hypothetical protein
MFHAKARYIATELREAAPAPAKAGIASGRVMAARGVHLPPVTHPRTVLRLSRLHYLFAPSRETQSLGFAALTANLQALCGKKEQGGFETRPYIPHLRVNKSATPHARKTLPGSSPLR